MLKLKLTLLRFLSKAYCHIGYPHLSYFLESLAAYIVHHYNIIVPLYMYTLVAQLIRGENASQITITEESKELAHNPHHDGVWLNKHQTL